MKDDEESREARVVYIMSERRPAAAAAPALGRSSSNTWSMSKSTSSNAMLLSGLLLSLSFSMLMSMSVSEDDIIVDGTVVVFVCQTNNVIWTTTTKLREHKSRFLCQHKLGAVFPSQKRRDRYRVGIWFVVLVGFCDVVLIQLHKELQSIEWSNL